VKNEEALMIEMHRRTAWGVQSGRRLPLKWL
jgi:hypothetical protein